MESLRIEATEATPQVDFNAENGVLTLQGSSFPEDAFGFYQPVIEWLENYSKSPNSTTELNLKLEYFNSTSAKQIVKILLTLETLSQNNTVHINWFYNKEEEDIYQSGMRYSALMSIDIKLVEYE